MKHLNLFDTDYYEFRVNSAGSDAFGPKIVSDVNHLPGTPMDRRSSLEEDANRTGDSDMSHYHLNGGGALGAGLGGSCTKLIVRNELNERRRSMEYVNRPPSPSHFIQFTEAAKESTFTDDSPMESPEHTHHHRHNPPQMSAKNGPTNNLNNGNSGFSAEKVGWGNSFNPSQEHQHNGAIPQNSPPTSNANLLGSNKGFDKEVSDSEEFFGLRLNNSFPQCDPESVMFRDGRRKIDMVLCYEEESEGVMTEVEARRKEQRRIFEENLVKEGLEIELEDKKLSFDEKTYFLKVHIPWRTETRIAEVMNLKLPVKQFITISVKAWVSGLDIIFCKRLILLTVPFLSSILFYSFTPLSHKGRG